MPVPSVVLESEVVGFSDVLQQTPRAVTDETPVTVTQKDAVVLVTLVTRPVVTEGRLFSLKQRTEYPRE